MPRIFADDADSVDVSGVIHFLIGGFSTNENSTTEHTEDHGKKKAVVATHLNMLTNESGENVSKFEVTVREMSHELRTPLTSIMVCGVAARGRELDGADSGYLTVISEESRKLNGMFNHYLSTLLVESENSGGDASSDL